MSKSRLTTPRLRSRHERGRPRRACRGAGRRRGQRGPVDDVGGGAKARRARRREAAGTLVLRRERRTVPLLLAAVPVHAALSLGWGALARILPREREPLSGAAAGVAIAALDLGVIGRRVPAIRDLEQLPQWLDHVAYGLAVGAVLRARLARSGCSRGGTRPPDRRARGACDRRARSSPGRSPRRRRGRCRRRRRACGRRGRRSPRRARARCGATARASCGPARR